jgi:hypothetical protein
MESPGNKTWFSQTIYYDKICTHTNKLVLLLLKFVFKKIAQEARVNFFCYLNELSSAHMSNKSPSYIAAFALSCPNQKGYIFIQFPRLQGRHSENYRKVSRFCDGVLCVC